jgi:hypothetical protein
MLFARPITLGRSVIDSSATFHLALSIVKLHPKPPTEDDRQNDLGIDPAESAA